MWSRKFRLSALVLSAAFSASGCDKEEDDGGEYSVVNGDASGCIQGVVTNALTGERISLDAARIYTAYNNSLYDQMQKLTEGVAADRKDDVVGDYRLCGVPNAGIQLPLYVKVDGYQTRIYGVTVSGATPNRNTNTAEPGFWVTPSVIQNVQLFKLADLSQQDFVVHVTNRGAVLIDAAVWLEPTPDVPGLTLAPQKTLTDASGNATFAAASIAFGASYTVTVLPKTPLSTDGSTSPAMTTTNVVLGVASAVNAGTGLVATDAFSLKYDVGVATGVATSAPVLVTSTPANTLSQTGAINLVFDRDIEYDKTSALVASLTTVAAAALGTKVDGTACVAADIGTPVTNPTQSVAISVSGRIATLTPVWTAQPSLATCGGVTLTYTLNALRFYAKNSTTVATTTGTNVTIYLTKPFVL